MDAALAKNLPRRSRSKRVPPTDGFRLVKDIMSLTSWNEFCEPAGAVRRASVRNYLPTGQSHALTGGLSEPGSPPKTRELSSPCRGSPPRPRYPLRRDHPPGLETSRDFGGRRWASRDGLSSRYSENPPPLADAPPTVLRVKETSFGQSREGISGICRHDRGRQSRRPFQ